VGAIAVVLGVGFHPFVQNLVHYSSDLVVDASQVSRLANATSYDTLGPLQGGFASSSTSARTSTCLPRQRN
jgi:hypothetical protein